MRAAAATVATTISHAHKYMTHYHNNNNGKHHFLIIIIITIFFTAKLQTPLNNSEW